MRKALTQAEFDQLPDGTPILVTWSGGNGPHPYYLRRLHGPYAQTEHEREHNIRPLEHRYIEHVGGERWQTRVELPDAKR